MLTFYDTFFEVRCSIDGVVDSRLWVLATICTENVEESLSRPDYRTHRACAQAYRLQKLDLNMNS